jgi:hypothetical protein
MFDDYFDDDTISGGWTESYTTLGSGVEYTLVVSGTISGAADRTYLRLYSGYGSVSTGSFTANGIYQSTADNFDIEIKIAEPSYLFYNGTNSYQAGIGVKVDENNYVYVYHNIGIFGYGYEYSYTVSGFGYGGGQALITGDYSLPPYYVRIIRSGTSYTMWYSENEYDEWVPGPPMTLKTGTCNVWLFCNQSTTSGTQAWADFEYFITVS